MIKKRAVLYFVIMAFPMGLGAGASSWLKLPQLPLSQVARVADREVAVEPAVVSVSNDSQEIAKLPDWSAVHPLVVGSFSLLLCSGILLAADGTKKV